MSKSSINLQQKTTQANNSLLSRIPLFVGRSYNFGMHSKNKTKALLSRKTKGQQNILLNDQQQIVPFVYSSNTGSRSLFLFYILIN